MKKCNEIQSAKRIGEQHNIKNIFCSTLIIINQLQCNVLLFFNFICVVWFALNGFCFQYRKSLLPLTVCCVFCAVAIILSCHFHIFTSLGIYVRVGWMFIDFLLNCLLYSCFQLVTFYRFLVFSTNYSFEFRIHYVFEMANTS